MIDNRSLPSFKFVDAATTNMKGSHGHLSEMTLNESIVGYINDVNNLITN